MLDLPIVNVINEGLTCLMIVTLVAGVLGNEVWLAPSVVPALSWNAATCVVFGAALVGSQLGQ